MNILKAISRFLKSSWYVILAILLGTIVGLIFGETAGVLTGFGFLIGVILYVFVRFIWLSLTYKDEDEEVAKKIEK